MSATKHDERPIAERIESLTAEIRRLSRRVDSEVPREIAEAQRRIEEAVENTTRIGDRIEDRRLERQRLLADGLDAAKLTREIQAIRGDLEVSEDLIAGLGDKISALRQEETQIVTETRPRLERQLAEVKVAPLIADYNAAAAQLAKISEAVIRLMEETHQPFGRGTTTCVEVSSWADFETIAQLGPLGQRPGPAFHEPWLRQQLRRETGTARSGERGSMPEASA